jgi:hypothetical protein
VLLDCPRRDEEQLEAVQQHGWSAVAVLFVVEACRLLMKVGMKD